MELRRIFAESLLVLLTALIHAAIGKLHLDCIYFYVQYNAVSTVTVISDFKFRWASRIHVTLSDVYVKDDAAALACDISRYTLLKHA